MVAVDWESLNLSNGEKSLPFFFRVHQLFLDTMKIHSVSSGIKVPACERRILPSLYSFSPIQGAMGQFAKCKRKKERERENAKVSAVHSRN